MPLNYTTYLDELLPDNLRGLSDLQKHLEAATWPLGNLQQGVEAALRLQHLSEPPAWLDSVGLTNVAALSTQVQEAMKGLVLSAIPALDLTGITQFQPVGLGLSTAFSEQLAKLAQVQQIFLMTIPEKHGPPNIPSKRAPFRISGRFDTEVTAQGDT